MNEDQRRGLDAVAAGVLGLTRSRFDLLRHVRDAARGFSTRELVVHSGQSRQGIHAALKDLQRRGLLELTRLGRQAGQVVLFGRPGPRLQALAPTFRGRWRTPRLPKPALPRRAPPPRRRHAPPSSLWTDALRERGMTVFRTRGAFAVARELGLRSLVPRFYGLVRDGEIVRVRLGTYRLARTAQPLEPAALAASLVPGSVVSGWSALHLHGLAPRPERVMLSGSRFIPSRLAGVGPVLPCRLVPRLLFGVTDRKLRAGGRARVFDAERVLVEMLARPRRFGGVLAGLELLQAHRSAFRLRRVVDHALRYRLTSVIRRVGWALERIGAPEVLLRRLEAHVGRREPQLLDPSGGSRGPINRRWRLIENERTEAAVRPIQ